MKRVHLYISGIVQGVFYRQNTKEQALVLNLKGWVKNLDDGRVEAIVEGETGNINKLIQWCNKGPSHSKVENVEVIEENYTNEFSDFVIIR